MTKISDILKAAASKIEKPEHWCKGAFATDLAGNLKVPYDPAAKCFCIQGAIRAVCLPSDNSALFRTCHIYPIFSEVIDEMRAEDEESFKGLESIPSFNDAVSHGTVLEAFRRAIAKAEKLETAA